MTISFDDVLREWAKNHNAPAHPLVKSFKELLHDDFPTSGLTDESAIQSLRKAMGANDNANGVVGMSPLILENLDATMTKVLITQTDFKLFNAIPRVVSMNGTYQWNRQKNFGSFRGTAGFVEGGAPNGSEAKFRRDSATIRYLGERGGVTHQLSVAGDLNGYAVDPVAQENESTTTRLLAKVERGLLRSNSLILDENGNTVHYDGLFTQMATLNSANIIDMQGQSIGFNNLEEVGFKMRTDGKLPNFVNLRGFGTPSILSDLSRLSLGTERTTQSSDGKFDLIPGTPFGEYASRFGRIRIEDSLFLDEVDGDKPLTGTTADDPADVGSSATPGSVSGTASGSGTQMAAGTYYYYVSSFNSKGESTVVASSGVAVTSGQLVTLTIARVTGAVGYRVYRSTSATATTARWIGTVPQTGSGSATFVDQNQQRPGSGTLVFFNADKSDIAIPQLAPMVKLPLGIFNTTMEFLVLLYHTLAVKAPERVLIFKNVGRSA